MRSIRIFAMILCACMLLPLAACIPTTEPEDTTTEQTTVAEEVTTEPGEPEPEPPQDAIEA